MSRLLQALRYQVVPTLLLFGMAAFTIYGEDGYIAYRARVREAAAAREVLAQVERENDRLLLRASSLHDDPVMLERLVADELRLVRPGGHLYVFHDEADGSPGARPSW